MELNKRIEVNGKLTGKLYLLWYMNLINLYSNVVV